ncbi:MAG TPA: ELM1/GtrOC1 family putative glycosyltransferase, partial [Marinobacterium sp.]|nr:ELM1/GtrOC1 family putative glycosyltransferase [Marinobacterium sp.]
MADIWVLTDGKPGHVNQSLGLAEALIRLRSNFTLRQLPVTSGWGLLAEDEPPRLIISAGRRTHLWSWLCKIRYGSKSVVLMRPSLPLCLFDLAFVPEHDVVGSRASTRFFQTRGALNRMRPGEKVPQSALILVGGPSKHVAWDSISVQDKIQRIFEENNDIQLRIVTSRRTPPDFIKTLKAMSGIELILPEVVDANWLPGALSETQRVWVTTDSVSMVFEALTAGCVVSLIGLESTLNSRTQRGMQMLLESGTVDYSTAFNSAL